MVFTGAKYIHLVKNKQFVRFIQHVLSNVSSTVTHGTLTGTHYTWHVVWDRSSARAVTLICSGLTLTISNEAEAALIDWGSMSCRITVTFRTLFGSGPNAIYRREISNGKGSRQFQKNYNLQKYNNKNKVCMNVTQWYASKCYRCNQIKELAIQILMDVLSAQPGSDNTGYERSRGKTLTSDDE